MKVLAVVLVVAGLLAMIVPGVVQTRPERGRESDRKESRMNPSSVMISVLPLMGVTFLAVGGAILVAGVITRKK